MQVDETKTTPKSLWRHLYQQVEEQSDCCDVTVQVGSWRRKFHWCVLSASPFFVKLYESKLQEQQTGLIKLNIGTSNSVQVAVHFLYGQCPKITLDNIGDILEVTEFLMIEELKAMCIRKLRYFDIDKENCLKILSLASRFEVYRENVCNFILSHLQELLTNDGMLLLDKESVRFILTDQMLSYVSRNDCFRFLINWVSHCPGRKSDFAELFSCISKDDLDADVLSTVSLECLSKSDRSLCFDISDGSDGPYDVLAVFPPIYRSRKYFVYAYNTRKKLWCQIKVKGNCYWESDARVTLQRPHTILSFKGRRQKIGFYNLITQDELEKRVEMTGDDDVPDFEHLAVSDTNVYCVSNFTHAEKGSNDVADNKILGIAELIAIQSIYGLYDLPHLPLIVALGGSRRKRINAACLYVSEKENQTEIRVKPLFSARGSVQSICVVDGVVCLLIPERKQLILYAERQHQVSKLDLSIYMLDENSYICPCIKGGLYVVTQTHILQIGIHVHSSDITANVSEIAFENIDYSYDWQSRAYPTLFEVLQDKVIAVTKCRESHENQFWYQPLPESIKYLDKEEKFDIDVPEPLKHKSGIRFQQLSLPKESLRCPLDCPHCNYEDKTPSRYMYYDYQRDNVFNEEVYSESDDDSTSSSTN